MNVVTEPVVRIKRAYRKSGRPRASGPGPRLPRRAIAEVELDDVELECTVFRPVPFSEPDKVFRALRNGPLSASDFQLQAGIDAGMLERVWMLVQDTGWLARLALDGEFVYHLAAPGDSKDTSGLPRQVYVTQASVAPSHEALSLANIFGKRQVSAEADAGSPIAVSSWAVGAPHSGESADDPQPLPSCAP